MKVKRDIHEDKKVNIVFDIFHIVGNSPITLFWTSKILVIGHDPTAQMRGILLFESSPNHTRCGGSRDEQH